MSERKITDGERLYVGAVARMITAMVGRVAAGESAAAVVKDYMWETTFGTPPDLSPIEILRARLAVANAERDRADIAETELALSDYDISALKSARASVDAERTRLREAIEWVLRDAAYRPPEEISDSAERWLARLRRSLEATQALGVETGGKEESGG